ncbi:AAA family ATPase [Photobacterium leiognathi]|uniref:AAA family ATPase n=1 Tax=Photobacterium leiognathi TaxID=553611 RepID=UPI002981C4AB|nr:AAA family ATPase [Photobacterium leiognathi]
MNIDTLTHKFAKKNKIKIIEKEHLFAAALTHQEISKTIECILPDFCIKTFTDDLQKILNLNTNKNVSESGTTTECYQVWMEQITNSTSKNTQPLDFLVSLLDLFLVEYKAKGGSNVDMALEMQCVDLNSFEDQLRWVVHGTGKPSSNMISEYETSEHNFYSQTVTNLRDIILMSSLPFWEEQYDNILNIASVTTDSILKVTSDDPKLSEWFLRSLAGSIEDGRNKPKGINLVGIVNYGDSYNLTKMAESFEKTNNLLIIIGNPEHGEINPNFESTLNTIDTKKIYCGHEKYIPNHKKTNFPLGRVSDNDMGHLLHQLITDRASFHGIESFITPADCKKYINHDLELFSLMVVGDQYNSKERVVNTDILTTVNDKLKSSKIKLTPSICKNLSKKIGKKVLNQDLPLIQIEQVIAGGLLNKQAKNGVLASMIFSGPSGVGKTLTAKEIANSLGAQFVQFNMTDFKTSAQTNTLLGTPNGYVGCNEAGALIREVRKSGPKVILLDEIEKAHPDIHDTIMPIPECGYVTDRQGNKYDMSECILILTTNSGSESVGKRNIGLIDVKPCSINHAELNRDFRTEFINRFDIVSFNSFTDKDLISKYVESRLKALKNDFSEIDICLTLENDVKEMITTINDKVEFGYRGINRMIEKYITNPLSQYIINHNEKISSVNVSCKDNKIKFEHGMTP